MKRILSILLLLSLMLAAAVPASAHPNSLASSKITFENKRMVVSLLVDQPSVLELDKVDLKIKSSYTEEELTYVMKEKLFAYIQKGFVVKNNGEPMAAEMENVSLAAGNNLQIDLVYSSDQLIDKVDLEYNLFFDYSNTHKNVATIESGETSSEFIFSEKSRTLGMEAGLEVPFLTAVKQFIILGVEHILTGYDHLMFLFALVLLGGTFKNMLKIITSFTVAHSITLILAALDIIVLPGRLVDIVVAASILYVAIENFVVKNTNYRWVLTFVFGLVHGFGFAGALAETQIPKNHFVSSLLTFNIGVELGHIMVVAILLPIILYVKRFDWNRLFVYGMSSVVGLFGLLWLVERVFDLSYMPM